jgi:uncharacterized protein (DUF952 family)
MGAVACDAASMFRWLYHLAHAHEAARRPYLPDAFEREGFVHASYAPAVLESHRLYFEPHSEVVVLCIDPRLLVSEVRVVDTPRGPMPHVHGPVNAEAIVRVVSVHAVRAPLPDLLDAR